MSERSHTDEEPTPVPPEPEPPSEPAPEPERAPTPDPAAAPTVEITPPAPTRARRLERSREDRVIAGVCGGLGEYFGVDAVLIRIAALVLVFAGGAGILLYAIGWIAMPDAAESSGAGEPGFPLPGVSPEGTPGAVVLGLIFVVLGVFFLVDEVWADFLSWKYVWPVALIVVGAIVLLRARQ
jgi:phage shock protein C